MKRNKKFVAFLLFVIILCFSSCENNDSSKGGDTSDNANAKTRTDIIHSNSKFELEQYIREGSRWQNTSTAQALTGVIYYRNSYYLKNDGSFVYYYSEEYPSRESSRNRSFQEKGTFYIEYDEALEADHMLLKFDLGYTRDLFVFDFKDNKMFASTIRSSFDGGSEYRLVDLIPTE